jgi:hypothetical protein
MSLIQERLEELGALRRIEIRQMQDQLRFLMKTRVSRAVGKRNGASISVAMTEACFLTIFANNITRISKSRGTSYSGKCDVEALNIGGGSWYVVYSEPMDRLRRQQRRMIEGAIRIKVENFQLFFRNQAEDTEVLRSCRIQSARFGHRAQLLQHLFSQTFINRGNSNGIEAVIHHCGQKAAASRPPLTKRAQKPMFVENQLFTQKHFK